MRAQQRLKDHVARLMRPLGGISELPCKVEAQLEAETAPAALRAGVEATFGGAPCNTGGKASAEARALLDVDAFDSDRGHEMARHGGLVRQDSLQARPSARPDWGGVG